MPEEKKDILLVEDEKKMASMYKQVFEEAGFKMRIALTSEEGLQELERKKPDLILLDILLPGEDGVDFLKRVRKSKEHGDLPVLVISNYDVPETQKEVRKLGVEGYLMKTDFTPHSLLEEVQGRMSDL